MTFTEAELENYKSQHKKIVRMLDSALGPSLGPSPVVTQQFGPSQGQELQPIDAEEDAGDV